MEEDESSRSPKRTETDKDENVSGSTTIDGSIGSSGTLSRRTTGALKEKDNDSSVAPDDVQVRRTDSEREEDRKRKQKDALKKKIPLRSQIRTVLFPNWYTINWLLLCSPVGIALNYVNGVNPLAVFVVNFIAIIPLAGILSFATEELAMRVGETLGGLLNASFG